MATPDVLFEGDATSGISTETILGDCTVRTTADDSHLFQDNPLGV